MFIKANYWIVFGDSLVQSIHSYPSLSPFSFQSKTLRGIAGAPWYVSNKTIHEDLNIPFITDVIKQQANRYRNRIAGHENQLIDELSTPHANERRLKKRWPEDLNT
jgi:hypothetical protein